MKKKSTTCEHVPCCEHDAEMLSRCAEFDIEQARRAFHGELEASDKWRKGWQWLVLALECDEKAVALRQQARRLSFSQASFLRYFDHQEPFFGERDGQ